MATDDYSTQTTPFPWKSTIVAAIGTFVAVILISTIAATIMFDFSGISSFEAGEMFYLGGLFAIDLQISMGFAQDSGSFAGLSLLLAVFSVILTVLAVTVASYIVAMGQYEKTQSEVGLFALAIGGCYGGLALLAAGIFGRKTFQQVQSGSISSTSLQGGSSQVGFTSTTDWVAAANPGVALLVAGILAAGCAILGFKIAGLRR